MPNPDSFILTVMGSAFISVGIGVMYWGRKKTKDYYDGLVSRTDLREFLERSPEHPEHSSFKIAGLVNIIVGAAMLGVGIGFRMWV